MKRKSQDANDPSRKHNISKRWRRCMTIPNSKKPEIISRTLGKANIKVATNSVARIKEFLGEKKSSEETSVV